jgi:predicted small metal-binding protein
MYLSLISHLLCVSLGNPFEIIFACPDHVNILFIHFKTITKMKTLHCSDAGFDCKAVVRGNTDEEILQQAAEHAKTVHHVEVTPEMAEQIKGLIKEEERS